MTNPTVLLSRTDTLFARDGGLHPPPEVLLSWPNPNYVDPEERGWEAPILLAVVLGITFLVYTARMWARLAISKNAGMDDLLMSVAMLPLFGLTISAILATKIYGFQWHAWDQTAESHITTREITLAIELNYLVSTTLIKISILCFYRRLSGSLKTVFVYGVWAAIASCVVYGLIYTFLLIFTCNPVIGSFRLFDMAWRLKNELKCLDEGAIIVSCAIISTIQDLVICLLPVFLVWNLKIHRRQKAALIAIFALGLVTCVCGIMRTYYATFVYYYTYDITWYAYPGWVWTALEADLGMICASAPALKVFFNRYFSVAGSSGGYHTGTYGQSIPMSRQQQFTGHSAIVSRGNTEAGRGTDSPFEGIKVSQNMDVRVEERDDVSQKSYASTRNLTALPLSGKEGWNGASEWIQGCRTVCVAALRPGSRSNSQTRSPKGDLEHGTATK